MHYDANTILETAEDIGHGFRINNVTLTDEDTAYAPGTTKHVYAGPGEIHYTIHASGWTVECTETITIGYRKD